MKLFNTIFASALLALSVNTSWAGGTEPIVLQPGQCIDHDSRAYGSAEQIFVSHFAEDGDGGYGADECQSANILLEQVCSSDGKVSQVIVDCELGCSAGACLRTSEPEVVAEPVKGKGRRK